MAATFGQFPANFRFSGALTTNPTTTFTTTITTPTTTTIVTTPTAETQ